MSVEYIVTQYQADIIGADEIGADDEGLGQAVRLGLFFIRESESQMGAILEDILKRPRSCGVEMMRISLMPASMSTDKGK